MKGKYQRTSRSKGFAAGCSREVIERGANQLGWELDKLFEMTILAMRGCEKDIADFMSTYTA